MRSPHSGIIRLAGVVALAIIMFLTFHIDMKELNVYFYFDTVEFVLCVREGCTHACMPVCM